LNNNTFIDSFDVSTRCNRQAATSLAIVLLEKIYLAEKPDQEKTPLILKVAYPMPLINILDSLVKAIMILDNTFSHYSANSA
jgi:hypothetical protein